MGITLRIRYKVESEMRSGRGSEIEKTPGVWFAEMSQYLRISTVGT